MLILWVCRFKKKSQKHLVTAARDRSYCGVYLVYQGCAENELTFGQSDAGWKGQGLPHVCCKCQVAISPSGLSLIYCVMCEIGWSRTGQDTCQTACTRAVPAKLFDWPLFFGKLTWTHIQLLSPCFLRLRDVQV